MYSVRKLQPVIVGCCLRIYVAEIFDSIIVC